MYPLGRTLVCPLGHRCAQGTYYSVICAAHVDAQERDTHTHKIGMYEVVVGGGVELMFTGGACSVKTKYGGNCFLAV